MNCPKDDTWTLASMDLLDAERIDALREHARTCVHCRERFTQARRTHIALLSHFEVMDRDHDERRERLMAALHTETPRTVRVGRMHRGWRKIGEITMNYPRTRNAVGLLTAAAAIIFAVTVLVGAWDGVAFADVVDQLRQIDTISCRIVSTTVTADERLTATGTMKISSKFGTRCDFDVNGGTAATLIKPVDEPAIVVTPSVKSYMVVEGADDDDGFDTMREPDAFLKKLTELTDSASESLGRSQIDGFNVVGFEIAPEQLELGLADAKAELFVDEETSLPVLFKLELAGPNPRTHVEVTYDQFEWNQPAPAELFELEIGDDYTEINVRVPAVDEAAFIEGMRVYAEVLDGRYPAELDLMPIITEVLQASANRAVADGKDVAHDSDEQGALRQQAMVLGAAVRFYGRLVSQGTKPEYFGDEVTADDVDSVLLQWRVDDRHVRIIYADLSAETVADSE